METVASLAERWPTILDMIVDDLPTGNLNKTGWTPIFDALCETLETRAIAEGRPATKILGFCLGSIAETDEPWITISREDAWEQGAIALAYLMIKLINPATGQSHEKPPFSSDFVASSMLFYVHRDLFSDGSMVEPGWFLLTDQLLRYLQGQANATELPQLKFSIIDGRMDIIPKADGEVLAIPQVSLSAIEFARNLACRLDPKTGETVMPRAPSLVDCLQAIWHDLTRLGPSILFFRISLWVFAAALLLCLFVSLPPNRGGPKDDYVAHCGEEIMRLLFH